MKSAVSTIRNTSTSFGEFMAAVAAFAVINALIMAPAVAVIREFISRVA
ncbi:MAG: hypothetical protein IIC22_07545 [Chloroflexi bacterium]|nr:hypothetical protein [Chloroflexota bacterium]